MPRSRWQTSLCSHISWVPAKVLVAIQYRRLYRSQWRLQKVACSVRYTFLEPISSRKSEVCWLSLFRSTRARILPLSSFTSPVLVIVGAYTLRKVAYIFRCSGSLTVIILSLIGTGSSSLLTRATSEPVWVVFWLTISWNCLQRTEALLALAGLAAHYRQMKVFQRQG